ncbi:MAG: 2-oxo acid dehydrogenase subunit E2 [Anaerolineae bacterium]|nr:2-oxo acid dehydrogenase subunit E2 [Anaerolineae bacterium]
MAEVVSLPALGAGITEGTFLNWVKNIGDTVKAGEVIAEIESDKATIEVESTNSGTITKQLVKPGDMVPVGAPIAEVGAGGEATAPAPAESAPAPVASAPAAPSVAANGSSKPAAPAPVAPSTSVGTEFPDGVKATPVARNIAEEKGINLKEVQGTGPGGRITKADVENYQPSAAPAPAPSAAAAPVPAVTTAFQARVAPTGPDIEQEPLSRMRERIATRMVESKSTIPHFYLTTEIDMAAVLNLRKQINATLPEEAKVTVNDIVVKAVALTLRQFPNLNSHFYGDKIVRYKRINIGIAVALEGGGLINVVARDADSVSISALAKRNKEMIAAVRNNKVKPEYIEGSTFTVSNLGSFEVDHFMAIINPPEAGILAVGSAKEIPVVINGEIKIANRMKVTLSVDHRVSDGAEGAQFLQAFKKLLESPMRLLL